MSFLVYFFNYLFYFLFYWLLFTFKFIFIVFCGLIAFLIYHILELTIWFCCLEVFYFWKGKSYIVSQIVPMKVGCLALFDHYTWSYPVFVLQRILIPHKQLIFGESRIHPKVKGIFLKNLQMIAYDGFLFCRKCELLRFIFIKKHHCYILKNYCICNKHEVTYVDKISNELVFSPYAEYWKTLK